MKGRVFFTAGLKWLVVARCGVHEMIPDLRGGGAGIVGAGVGVDVGVRERRGAWGSPSPPAVA